MHKNIFPRKCTTICFLGLMVFTGCTTTKQKESESVQQDEPKQQRVSMAFTGDLLFEQGLYDSQKAYQFGSYFDQVKPYLDRDLTVGNQEVPIGGEELGVSGVAFTFNAPKQVAEQLPDVGFDVMTLSNNHSYDMGIQGVLNTLTNLKESGIETVGMYGDEASSKQIKVIEKNGIKIAFLAYTYDTNKPIEEQHQYVVKPFLNDALVFDEVHREMIRQDVARAKDQADVVIASMHWGNEFTYAINETQLQATNVLNEAGVDLIIGNHPHCLQTMEEVTNDVNDNKTIVFYSLGNFVSSAADVDRASEAFTNMYQVGGIVNLEIVKDGKTGDITFENMNLIPIVNHFDHGYQNFALIPLKEYTEEMAQIHDQRAFSKDFNKAWITSQIHTLFEGKIKIVE